MSKIDELLKNEKVEWKKLGEVCTISKGKQMNKIEMSENGKYPVINGGISPSGYIDMFNTNENTITVSQGGASAGFVNFIEEKFWLGAHAFSVIPNNEKISKYNYDYSKFNRFIFHILKMNQVKIQNSKEGAGIPSVSKSSLSNIQVPIISKVEQERIVEKLDKFTEYIFELQKESKNRTKQYEHYRDRLLSKKYLEKIALEHEIVRGGYARLRILKLEDIVKIKNGKDWKKLNKGNIPVYGSGGYMDVNVDKYSYDKPSVLIPRKGSIENVIYLDKAFWNVDTIYYTEIDESKIIPKYFYYFMKTVDLNALSTNTTRPSLTQTILNKIKINLPPLEIQNKVVEVLDKFQDLLSETQGLLPKEIEERQKQYEYYREKLLTFDEEYVERGREREHISLTRI